MSRFRGGPVLELGGGGVRRVGRPAVRAPEKCRRELLSPVTPDKIRLFGFHDATQFRDAWAPHTQTLILSYLIFLSRIFDR